MMGFHDHRPKTYDLPNRSKMSDAVHIALLQDYIKHYTPQPKLDTEDEGSAERFEHRLKVFKERKMSIAVHNWWWFVHNVIAHPMIGIAPCKRTFAFHDWTSRKINGE
jgi:hypothetical protein